MATPGHGARDCVGSGSQAVVLLLQLRPPSLCLQLCTSVQCSCRLSGPPQLPPGTMASELSTLVDRACVRYARVVVFCVNVRRSC